MFSKVIIIKTLIEPIKVYQHPDTDSSSLSFSMKRMEDLYELAKGKADHPHRHAYFTIIWAIQANGIHRMDFEDYPIGNNHLFFVSPGQVHQLIAHEKPYGWVLNFSESFLIQNNIRRNFITDIHLFRNSGTSPALVPNPDQSKNLTEVIQLLEKTWEQDIPFKYEAIGALLKLFLIYANDACTLPEEQHTQQTQAGKSILSDFKTLVEQHFTKEHKVGFYADQLAVSTDHLNKTVKSLIGQSPKSFIQDRIILEAKRLLKFTNHSAKALSYQLGFEEPAHFSAFFKKCTGASVRTFRGK